MELINNKASAKPASIVGQITAIFFIEASSAAAFAVFFSGLSLYLTQQIHYTKENAAIITGLFLSLNYFLQLVGGMIADRIITYKRFYSIGAVTSAAGCFLLAYGINLNIGLSLCLMSSLVTNVCMNMFITTLFTKDQVTERRIAFIWTYVGMNLGFLIGYFLTGYYTILNSYFHLFIAMGILTLVSLGLTLAFIRPSQKNSINKPVYFQYPTTLLIILGLLCFIFTLFNYSSLAQKCMTISLLFLFSCLINYAYKKSSISEKKKIIHYAFYSVIAIFFWTIYMLTPIAFMQIIENDVQNTIFGFTIPPQWFVNIDSIVILIIAPNLAFLLNNRKDSIEKPLSTLSYFALAFAFVALAFTTLLIGLFTSIDQGKLPMWIMLGYLIFLTIGEIFISPTGNSLIGELIPESLRGLMTGAWSMNIGIGGLLASLISNKVILPHIDKYGLIRSNLVQFENIMIIICLMLILLIGLLCFLIANSHRLQKVYFTT